MGLITTPYRPTQLSPGGLYMHNPLWKPPITAELDCNHPLARGLAGCWLMNEGGGTLVRDASGGISHGTVSGATRVISERGPVLYFDGNNDWVDISQAALPAFGTRDFTVVAWVKLPQDDTARAILSKGNVSVGEFLLEKSSSDALRVYAADSGVQASWGGTDSWPSDVWTQVAITRSGARVTLYQNAVPGGTDTTGSGDINTTIDWRIGARANDTSDYIGYVSDVGIWYRALTPAEIRSLYLDPYQMFRRSPIELWTAGASGGSAYTETINDSLGISDASVRACTFSRTLTESLGTTDALGNASVAIRDFAESFGLTDSLGKDEGKVLSEAMGIVDSMIDVWQASRSIADSMGITDVPVKEYVALRAVVDAVGLTDDVSDLWAAIRTIADSLGITDAMSHVYSGVSNYVQTIADSLGLSDVMSPVHVLLRVMSDALGMSDAVVSIFTASRVVSDSVGITDGLFLARMVAVADTVGITDDFSRLVTFLRTLEDSEGLVDAVARVLHASRTFTESMGMTDAMSHQFGDVAKAAIAFMLLRKRR